MQHAALDWRPCDFNLSRQHIATSRRGEVRFPRGAVSRRPTQRKGDRGKRLRNRNRTGQAREEIRARTAASNSSRCSAPSAIGAAIVSAIAISVAPESMRGARRQHACRRIRRKADDDDRIARMESAEIEIFGTRAADQLHLVGPEQAKLVIEQFRHAAAAAKAGNPDPLRRMQGPAALATELAEMRARPAASASNLSATSDTSELGPAAPGPGSARERRGLLGPARLGQGGAQFIPSRITQRFRQPGEGRGIGAGHGGQIRASNASWRHNRWRQRTARLPAAASAATAGRCTVRSAARTSIAAGP